MYRLLFTTVSKQAKQQREFLLGEYDTADYDHVMEQISDLLYEMDLDFDPEGDGDLLIDDLLIAISEEEDVDQTLQGKDMQYRIVGCMV